MRRWLLVFPTVILLACGDGTDAPAGTTCPALGAPVSHAGWLTADEVWSGDRPHVITNELTVSKGVTLTIEPCAQVRLKQGIYFYVQGKLVARGTATKRIRFMRDVESERFAAIWVTGPGSADLAYADLEGGGAKLNQSFGATLVAEGEWPPSAPLRVEHVTVKHSAGYGIYLRKWGGFAAGSTGLTVQSSGEEDTEHPFAIRMTLNTVGTLPEGSYTGNAKDEIQLIGESPHNNVEVDETIRNRGVPYQVGGNGMFGIIAVKGASPTLTIEPGVILKFFSSGSNIGYLEVGGTGSGVGGQLVAVGTPAAPIRLVGTGLGSGPGSWEGVNFFGTIAPGNRIEEVVIDGAGAHGGDIGFGCPPPGITGSDGAVKLFSEPPSAFIKNTVISNSSSHGIYRAWTGAPVELMGSNRFENIAGCNEILPKPETGSCPKDPPCPR